MSGAKGKGKGKAKAKSARKRRGSELELFEWRQDVQVLKGFFKSFLWKYPVQAFIGEVVKGQPPVHASAGL